MKVTTTCVTLDRHDVAHADAEGVVLGTPPTVYLRGGPDAMERLARAAAESARIQRSQVQLPGCDGSQMGAA